MALWRAVGSVFRSTGQALDSLGCALQGRLAYRETLNKAQTIGQYQAARPVIGQDVFVAPNSSVIGDVNLGNGSSIWYGAILRGDVNKIVIGEKSNIQDNVMIHVAKHNPEGKPLPTIIGKYVTIGHGATIHAATIEDNTVIGMGATVMDGAKVEKQSIVAAGALVTPGTVVKTNQVWAGVPAKYLRDLLEGEAEFISQSAEGYSQLAAVHAAENAKTFDEIEADIARREDRLLRDPEHDAQHGLERDPVTREIVAVAQST